MSLLNQMLRNLDRRSAAVPERAGLPAGVLPLPAAPRATWTRWLALALCLALGGAGMSAWVFHQSGAVAARTPAASSVTVAPQSPPTQTPSATPQGGILREAVAHALPSTATEQPVQPVAPTDASVQPATLARALYGMKLTTGLPDSVDHAATGGNLEPKSEDNPSQPKTGKNPSGPAPETTPPAPSSASATSRTERKIVPVMRPLSSGASQATPPSLPQAPSSAGSPVSTRDQPRSVDLTPRERSMAEFQRAVMARDQGREEDAVAAYQAALRADPDHARVRLAYAEFLMGGHKLGEARTVLHEGLTLDANQPALALALARVQVELGALEAAAQTLRTSAGSAGEVGEYRGFQAGVLQRLGRHTEAIKEYAAALRLVPDAGVWWMGLGLSLQSEGRNAEAREALRLARASGGLSPELALFVEKRAAQLQ